MDKLEHYLDLVCRGIGGPRSLRLHLRQELREHLLDAVAEHQLAGLSHEEALARALTDFGGPEQVRAELEATHGHGVMAIVIDRAMQWKERTMKAKWLWMTWVHLALVGVIALELMWITFVSLYLVPKFERLLRDGYIDRAILQEQEAKWMPAFLFRVRDSGEHAIWMVLVTALVWGLFEWRVRGDNKTFMRLSGLGTAALGLMVIAILVAGSLVIPYMVAAPAAGRLARPFALDQVASIDTSLRAIEQAMPKKDWDAMQESVNQASRAANLLAEVSLVVGSLAPHHGSPTPDELRTQLKSASDSLLDVRRAIQGKDAERLKVAMATFRESYGTVEQAAKKLQK